MFVADMLVDIPLEEAKDGIAVVVGLGMPDRGMPDARLGVLLLDADFVGSI
jgi:hypothetical protein